MIVDRIPVGAPDGALDLEGIAARDEGASGWRARGRVGDRLNGILRVDDDGGILETVEFPPTLAANATSSGFEGVAVTGTEAGGDEEVYVVIQREWDDDADGVVKIGRYDVAAGAWTFVSYVLDAVESPARWMGRSLRDHCATRRQGRHHRTRQPARPRGARQADLRDRSGRRRLEGPHGSELDVVDKTLLSDILADLDDASISVPDKVEGLGLTADGHVWMSTDNDGVDENDGETLLVELGSVDESLAVSRG